MPPSINRGVQGTTSHVVAQLATLLPKESSNDVHLRPTDDLGMNLLMSVIADSRRGKSTFLMGSVSSASSSGGETIP